MSQFKFGDRVKVKNGVKRLDTNFSGATGDFLFYYGKGKEVEVELITSNNTRFRTKFGANELEKAEPDRPEVFCQYCGEQAKLVTGKELYPHRPDLASIKAYQCKPCDATVGCHKGTENPLGVLAKPELKKLKQKVHAAFDPVWKSGEMKRNEAYQWLADLLDIDPDKCHVGMFNEDMCNKALKVLAEEGYR